MDAGDNRKATITMARITEFHRVRDWVEDNPDKIDDLPDLKTPPYPWTYAYKHEYMTLDMFTPLDMAIIAGRRDIIEKLIAKGARTDNLENMMECMYWEPEDVRAVLALLPDQRPGFHPLSEAIRGKDAGKLEALLDQGGDPNSQRAWNWNDDGTAKETETVLEVAASKGDLACAALLVRRGALIQPEAIARAIERRSDAVAMTQLFLGTGGIQPLHSADAQGETPLHRVVGCERNGFPARDRYALTTLLIEHGADVNAAAHDGTTPLWAVCRGFYQSPEKDRLTLVALLIKHGAEVNVSATDTGTTPLMFAGARGDLKVMSLLLGAGADPLARDAEGRTALDFARMRGRDKAVEMLLLSAGSPEQVVNGSRAKEAEQTIQ